MLSFIELQVFTKRLMDLAEEHADDVLLQIQSDLIANPIVEGLCRRRAASENLVLLTQPEEKEKGAVLDICIIH